MHDEDDFLRKLLENPADDTVRLVYADWLDERDDEQSRTKATFLRLTAQLLERGHKAGWHKARRKEMQPLAAKLPTDWLAVVSRLRIDSCGAKVANDRVGRRFLQQFEFVCDKDWTELSVTDNTDVRFCEQCEQNVHYCDTITVARRHARQGHCVAVDLGIIRRGNDLNPPIRLMGRMLPSQVAGARRSQVDDVSREREEQKRQQKKGDAV